MKTVVMQLTLLALILAVCAAFGLQCHSCSDADCEQPMTSTCGDASKCSIRVMMSSSMGQDPMMNITKGCVPAANCSSSAEPRVWSFNLGGKEFMALQKCCDGDNCNAPNASWNSPWDASWNSSWDASWNSSWDASWNSSWNSSWNMLEQIFEHIYDTLPPAGGRECPVCDPDKKRCRMKSCFPGEVCAKAKVAGPNMERDGPKTLFGCMSKSLCDHDMFKEHFGQAAVSLSCSFPDNGNPPDPWEGWRMEEDDDEGWWRSVFSGGERALPLSLLFPLLGLCTLDF